MAPLLLRCFALCSALGPGGPARLDEIELPPGFAIDHYAADVPGARSMALSPSGILFVGTRTHDVVYAVLDTNRDQRADRVVTVAQRLTQPNGVALLGDDLYIAESDRIIRLDSIESRVFDPPEPVVIYEDFPVGGQHSWKYLAVGPDSLLYVSVGSPCNVCEPEDERHATIMRLRPDGTGAEVFARGVRNSVGFDWRPADGVMWFTDNGRDWLGDNLPPDELNRAPVPGLDFGWPYAFGRNVRDPEYSDHDISGMVPAARDLGPHVAALGMRFYTGEMFPAEYRGRIFVAEHGSWNRTTPIGYRVMQVALENDSAVSYEEFARGWLRGVTAWGRPVDVQVMPDGALLVSDDKAGAVYRVSYRR